MTDDNDEFTGIFDDLSPEDFLRDTSARHVAVAEHQPFGDFVNASLEAARFAFHAADGQPNPVTVLIGSDGRRMYTPDDDEVLGDYLNRLHREATTHKAHTVFTLWLTRGGAFDAGKDQNAAVDDEDVLAEAEEAGAMRPCLYWFAQHKSEVRHGIMQINDNGDTGEVLEAQPEHAAAVYRAILGG